MSNSYWIWYPGDFELYHGMKQNFSRVERGYGWPAFWKSEGFRNRVAFRRTYQLEQEECFCVYSNSVGFVMAGEKKYPFGTEITCPAGEVSISIHAGCIESFPCIYIEGKQICSDESWMVEDYSTPAVPVGRSRYFTKKEQNPAHWEYSEKIYEPVCVTECNGGVLFEFETELTAVLQVEYKKGYRPLTVYCGESREEALDLVHCYYSWQPDPQTGKCPCCGVCFAFVSECSKDEISLTAIHQYVDIPIRGKFQCDDERLNQIWSVAEHTFRLCSGIFFIDGIKRDKWIWSGDAYQSFFVNQYLMADPDIDQRTLLALRGNDPMTTHINTIVDYSLFWILGVKFHYDAYGDMSFLRQVYPKMCSLMEFCEARTEGHGFLTGQEKDWVYIDWADLDKDGPLAAEQMLYAACWKAMAQISAVLGQENPEYLCRYEQLTEAIQTYYWDQEKGAYIDSFTSGKRFVTRQSNIFAVLFGIADEEKQQQIIRNVIYNEEIPAITTPYFNFFELDMLCRTGNLEVVIEKIRSYWGGMLDRGAVTFWEEFDPSAPVEEQYDMYGDKFGKSLCHAWSASPIYFLSKYFMGLKIQEPGAKAFLLEPHPEYFREFACTLPAGAGNVHLQWDGRELSVETDIPGGILNIKGESITLIPGQTTRVTL
jgi:hypothetical protein